MKTALRSLLVLMLAGAFFGVLAQPEPPANLTATVSFYHNSAKVTLAWEHPDTTHHGVKFKVYRKEGGINDTTAFKRIASNVYYRSFKDNSARLNKTYTYKVTAYNSSGESAASNQVEVSTVPPPPPAQAVVTGVVTNETTGAPIARAYVSFFQNTSHGYKYAYTDSLGQYKVRLNPGSYYLYTSAHQYKWEYYDNVTSLSQATQITLAEADSQNVNVALTAIVPPVTYSISGSVKDAAGNPINSKVRVYKVRLNSRYYFVRESRTDSLGNFTVSNVRENDTVVVFASPFNRWDWYAEYYNDKRNINEADRIAVTGNVTDINFVLEHTPIYPNSVSGVVKDTLGTGVPSMVHAFPKRVMHPAGHPHFRRYAVPTDSLGVFSFNNLIPGEYIFLAVPNEGFKPSYFTYSGVPTLNWRDADSVVVDSASAVTGININVLAIPDSGFASVVGIVKDNAGRPINGAFVYAVNDEGVVYSVAVTNTNGQYVLAGLVPNTYEIIADKQGYTSSVSAEAQVDYVTAVITTANFRLEEDGVTAVENEAAVVDGFELFQNYPNPFNPSTTISYQLASDVKVTLKVFDILGNEVATLVNGFQNTGKHQVTFNANGLASGLYIYKLDAGSFSATRKFMLMK